LILYLAPGYPTASCAPGSIEARPDCVFVPIGWDEQQPYHPGAGVNHLTGTRLDPVSRQANLKTHLCRVEKASY